jgi:uncharacterized protein (TIGR02246 family)
MNSAYSNEIRMLYQQLLHGWNKRDAKAMAELFTQDGEMIGFDGSQSIGNAEIFSHLEPIFENHPTACFVSKVREVLSLSPEVSMLRAIAGMVPPGQSDINPSVNTHHTLIAVKQEGKWLIALYQNTPAQFHGRPELVEKMTDELRQLL